MVSFPSLEPMHEIVYIYIIWTALCFLATGLKVRLGDPLDQSISPSAACFTALPSNDMILVCGFWDNSFKCFNTDSGEGTLSFP